VCFFINKRIRKDTISITENGRYISIVVIRYNGDEGRKVLSIYNIYNPNLKGLYDRHLNNIPTNSALP